MMLDYEFLREALYEILMLGLGGFLSVAFIIVLRDALKAPVRLVLREVVRKHEKHQEQLRMAYMFHLENIPGTNGYRIKGR